MRLEIRKSTVRAGMASTSFFFRLWVSPLSFSPLLIPHNSFMLFVFFEIVSPLASADLKLVPLPFNS